MEKRSGCGEKKIERQERFFFWCKAIDMVDHQLLLQKMPRYGVGGSEFRWFGKYTP